MQENTHLIDSCNIPLGEFCIPISQPLASWNPWPCMKCCSCPSQSCILAMFHILHSYYQYSPITSVPGSSKGCCIENVWGGGSWKQIQCGGEGQENSQSVEWAKCRPKNLQWITVIHKLECEYKIAVIHSVRGWRIQKVSCLPFPDIFNGIALSSLSRLCSTSFVRSVSQCGLIGKEHVRCVGQIS